MSEPSGHPGPAPAASMAPPTVEPEADVQLEGLIQRINSMTGRPAGSAAGHPPMPTRPRRVPATPPMPPRPPAAPPPPSSRWMPTEPASLQETGLSDTEMESLILKFLLVRGDATGRVVASQIRLPFILVDQLLRRMKDDRLVVYRGAAQMNDYVYQVTELGREQARRYMQECTYFGAAPVTLTAYIDSVGQQSLRHLSPNEDDLRRAFSDLLVNQAMFRRLGPAICSGRGMFLFGYPGNGKTSIAERVTRCFGENIWVPRAISVDGEILRVFDPNHHEAVPQETADGLLATSHVDHRWILIKRPTVIVGGELTMDQLEIQTNRTTGISEAPLQLKSNCGTLVIDDFGRQKMSVDELLNRWIVPLEKRYDFLCMPSGKTIQVPFDQLVVFSTNLEPKDLVDDAFLRRIPYKIEVPDPTEEEFKTLFRIMSPKLGFEYDETAIQYLIDRHYRAVNRPFRCCQPRDLLLQVRNYCLYSNEPLSLSSDRLDFAVENYFSVM